MKTLLNSSSTIYIVGAIASLCIMIIIDFVLGPEAEHLNAWVIVNRLFGIQTNVGDSLAIQYLGLYGAALLMVFVNTLFGIILVKLISWTIHFIHA